MARKVFRKLNTDLFVIYSLNTLFTLQNGFYNTFCNVAEEFVGLWKLLTSVYVSFGLRRFLLDGLLTKIEALLYFLENEIQMSAKFVNFNFEYYFLKGFSPCRLVVRDMWMSIN